MLAKERCAVCRKPIRFGDTLHLAGALPTVLVHRGDERECWDIWKKRLRERKRRKNGRKKK